MTEHTEQQFAPWTPGPWKADHDGSKEVDIRSADEWIATAWGEVDGLRKNADLIAIAPEMAEAIIGFYGPDCVDYECYHSAGECHRLGRVFDKLKLIGSDHA